MMSYATTAVVVVQEIQIISSTDILFRLLAHFCINT